VYIIFGSSLLSIEDDDSFVWKLPPFRSFEATLIVVLCYSGLRANFKIGSDVP
jgi:hypothetical protein